MMFEADSKCTREYIDSIYDEHMNAIHNIESINFYDHRTYNGVGKFIYDNINLTLNKDYLYNDSIPFFINTTDIGSKNGLIYRYKEFKNPIESEVIAFKEIFEAITVNPFFKDFVFGYLEKKENYKLCIYEFKKEHYKNIFEHDLFRKNDKLVKLCDEDLKIIEGFEKK